MARGTVGVIVGRFQVPELHEAHRKLINYSLNNFDETEVLVGVARIPSKNNPLPTAYCLEMLEAEYGGLIKTHYILDEPDNKVWSTKLDKYLRKYEGYDVTLVGGRDSFIPHYTGDNKTVIIPEKYFESSIQVSGSDIRSSINRRDYDDQIAFRAGYIKAVQDRRDVINCTVDIIVTKGKGMDAQILLGKKHVEDGWRIPGGFIDKGETAMEAAKRELEEETGIVGAGLYLAPGCTRTIKDWRFRNSTDSILTHIFYCDIDNLGPQNIAPGDDLAKLQWFSLIEPPIEEVADAHKPLVTTEAMARRFKVIVG